MRDLHARLALAIYSQNERCRNGFNRKDWKENLLRAKDLIRRRKLASNDDLAEITLAIIPRRRAKNWRKQLCGCCHTPLLIGYSLDGEQITRGKEYCSPACKMRFRRYEARKRRRAAAGLIPQDALDTARRKKHELEGKALGIVEYADEEKPKPVALHIALKRYSTSSRL